MKTVPLEIYYNPLPLVHRLHTHHEIDDTAICIRILHSSIPDKENSQGKSIGSPS